MGHERLSDLGTASKTSPTRTSNSDWPATRTCRCASAKHANGGRLPSPGERRDHRPRLRFYDRHPELGDSSPGHQNRPPVFRQGSADTDARGGPDQLSGLHGIREYDHGNRSTESHTPFGSSRRGRLTSPSPSSPYETQQILPGPQPNTGQRITAN